MARTYGEWNTEDELHFIDCIGRHRTGKHMRGANGRADRKILLESYLQSIRARVVWGLVDKKTVIDYAETAIKKEEGRDYETNYL